MEPYTRSGINEMIESLGAHAGSSVSRKTDYLVCGENAGSKLAVNSISRISACSKDFRNDTFAKEWISDTVIETSKS